MAVLNSIFCFSLVASAFLVILGRPCSCLHFNYPSFDTTNKDDFSFSSGSGIANGSLQITPSSGNMSSRSGRVYYAREKLSLWNSRRRLTSFRTEFVLSILPHNGTGEGMAFILTNKPELPRNSCGQWLGIVNNQTDGAPMNRIIAVEFDTRKSNKDDLDGNHVGLDINTIKSVAPYPLSNVSIVLSRGSDILVRIEYDGARFRIEAMQEKYVFSGGWSIYLSQYLMEGITLGFSASTGEFTEFNQIKSWHFNTLGDGNSIWRHMKKLKWLLAFLISLAFGGAFLAFYMWRRLTRQSRLAYRNLEKMIDAHGPVKFKLRELRNATANFSADRKLGRGGFGTVYLGYLNRMGTEVAVKRVSSTRDNTRRGEQEFVAEVNTISKLSHRNLVKLIGWCHERGELLLVYEYFPMGSLDKLLYTGTRGASPEAATPPELTWERRYRIICGVASALDYLHHGSSKRILHRDVKASNVMLDDGYNAWLGDFGLARVVHRDGATHHSTQAVAGTRAYMAYESFFTGRASLDTDVYAFGVFAMEVLSGRRPSSSVSYQGDGDEHDEATRWRRGQPMYIVDWTWRLYGEGKVLHAADAVLNGDFDQMQVDCVVRLSLACCHPNPRERPSMRTAVQVLIGGAPSPEPPLEKPAFVWPPVAKQQEIELPHVGVLFTGGQLSFCSMTSGSITGR